MKQRLTRRSKFTLLELLVVIAVAALLFSISTAALGRAWKRAAEAKDMNNLRDLQQGIANYYANSPRACFRHPDIPEFLIELNLISSVPFCPIRASLPKKGSYHHSYNSNGFLFHRYRGEEYDKWGFGYDEQRPWMHKPVLLAHIKNPSSKLILAEADDTEDFGPPPMLGAFYPAASFYLAEEHHSGKRALCGWGDGHVTMEENANERFMKTGEQLKRWSFLEPEI